MKKLRWFICFIVGHRSICLHRFTWNHDIGASTETVWRCERCGHEFTEQFDM